MIVMVTADTHEPAPAAMPTAATAHRLAAVVRPRIVAPSLRIAPAPRNPTPVTICAATRAGSAPGALKASIERTVNAADPIDTRRWVRIPAGWSWTSRSRPMAAPRAAATTSRHASSSWMTRSAPIASV